MWRPGKRSGGLTNTPPATARAVPFPAPNANQPPALIPGAGSFLWHGSVSEHSTRRCQPAPRLRHVERRWGAFVATGLFRPRGAEAPDGSYTGTSRFRTATPVRCAVRPRRRQIAVHLRRVLPPRPPATRLVARLYGLPAHCLQCSTQCQSPGLKPGLFFVSLGQIVCWPAQRHSCL